MRSGIWKPELHPRDRRGRFVEVFRAILRLNLGEHADLGKILKGAVNVDYARVHRTREGWEIRAQTATGTYGVRVRPEDMKDDDHFEAAIASLDVAQPFPGTDPMILNPAQTLLERNKVLASIKDARDVRRWDPEAPGAEYELDPDLYEQKRADLPPPTDSPAAPKPETPSLEEPADVFGGFFADIAKRADYPGDISADLLAIRDAREKRGRTAPGRFKDQWADDETPARPQDEVKAAPDVAEKLANIRKVLQDLRNKDVSDLTPDDAEPHFEKLRAAQALERETVQAIKGHTRVSGIGEVEEGDIVVLDGVVGRTWGVVTGKVKGAGRYKDAIQVRYLRDETLEDGGNAPIGDRGVWEPNPQNPNGPQIYKTNRRWIHAEHRMEPGRQVYHNRDPEKEYTIGEIRPDGWMMVQNNKTREWELLTAAMVTPTPKVDKLHAKVPGHLRYNYEIAEDLGRGDARDRERERGGLFDSKDARTIDKTIIAAFARGDQIGYEGWDNDDFQRARGVNIDYDPGFMSYVDDPEKGLAAILELEPGEGPVDLGTLYKMEELPDIQDAVIWHWPNGWSVEGTNKDGSSFYAMSGPGELTRGWLDRTMRWHGRREAPAQRRIPKPDPTATSVYIRQEAEDIRDALQSELGMPSGWDHQVQLSKPEDMPGGVTTLGTMMPYGTDLNDMQIRYQVPHDVAEQPDLHLTLGVHEMLHGFSLYHSRGNAREFDFQKSMAGEGWEEGVVENLSHFLRPHVATRLGYKVDDLMHKKFDLWREKVYPGYTEAFERVRRLTDYEPIEYYRALIASPAVDRPKLLASMSRGVAPENMAEFDRVVRMSSATLSQYQDLDKIGPESSPLRKASVQVSRGNDGLTGTLGIDEGFTDEFFKDYLDAPGLEDANVTVLVSKYFDGPTREVGGIIFDVEASRLDENGAEQLLFTMSRNWEKRNPTEIKAMNFDVARDVRGQGIGRAVTTQSLEALKKRGFERVTTFAAGGPQMNGAYTWARLGFDFRDSDQADEMRETFRRRLQFFRDQVELEVDDGSLDDDDVAIAVEKLNNLFGRAERQIEEARTANDFASFRLSMPESLGGQSFNTPETMTTGFFGTTGESGYDAVFDLTDGSSSWRDLRSVNEAISRVQSGQLMEPKKASVSPNADIVTDVQRRLNGDPAARKANEVLRELGDVYIVGGAVRDSVLNKDSHDVDLMARVDPVELEAALRAIPDSTLDLTGKDFGVYRFKVDGGEVEIALPRTEKATGDGGHKDFEVTGDHTLSVEDDLVRRDYTANAIAINANTGEIHDPHQGIDDVRGGILRSVSPTAMRDDPLRTVRGLVAHAKHGLSPDEETIAQMREYAAGIKKLPGTRIQGEIMKMMESPNPAAGMRLARDTGVLEHLIPDVAATFGFDQKNPHHNLDLGEHLLAVLEHVSEQTDDPLVRLAALLHDIGKPSSQWLDEDGVGHYYENKDGLGGDHDIIGAEMAGRLMDQMQFSNADKARVKKIIENHMFPNFETEKGARKFLSRTGAEADSILALRYADRMGKGTQTRTPEEVQGMRDLVTKAREAGTALSVKDLAITGKDLMAAGVPEGPEIGKVLQSLLQRVLDDPELNTTEKLLAIAIEA